MDKNGEYSAETYARWIQEDINERGLSILKAMHFLWEYKETGKNAKPMSKELELEVLQLVINNNK